MGWNNNERYNMLDNIETNYNEFLITPDNVLLSLNW